ncbi:hypothetical protein [Gelidibacter sp.]|uniref:hypothetical protein n=1 Tax=Gelidibacter sp. TaxID=2018083 RepID=UPI0032643C04
MKRILTPSLLLMMTIGFFTSCNEITKRVEDKITELDAKAVYLDSLVNKEIGKVLELDTLISSENFKVKKLDSLIQRNSSKIDSVARKKIQLLDAILN